MSISPETILTMLETSFQTCDGHEECDNPDHDETDWEHNDAAIGEWVDITVRHECINCGGTWSENQTYSYSDSTVNDS